MDLELSRFRDAVGDSPHDLAVLLYLGSLVLGVVLLVGGSVLFPRQLYWGFVWEYFWGPVYADAHGAGCAIKSVTADGALGDIVLEPSKAACAGEPFGAVVGYTPVNEVGYAVVLVYAVVGLVLMLRRYGIGDSRALFYGLLPFMFLGGSLRVVEDAANAARLREFEPAITYPWNSLLISPVIYFTVFFLTLAALAVALWAHRRGYVDGYERALAGIGSGLLAISVVYLLMLAFTTEYVYFLPQFAIVVLAGATVVTAVTWYGVEQFAPWLNEGTGYLGALILWGHSIDGVANVVGLDWGAELGYPTGDLIGKHPVNRAVVDATTAVLPESITHFTGTAWPFVLLKVAVVLVVLAIFDERAFEENPRYTILMLVAILAVGLGPGTRDMLRATFGI